MPRAISLFSVALILCLSGFAEETDKPKCDCKPLGIQVVRNGVVVNAIGVGPRATTNTDIFNFAYTPLTIQVGDTVVWTNKDGAPHSATSNTGVFDTGVLNFNESGSFTFTQAGTFPYFCSVHPFMTSTVTVTEPNPSITSPLTATAVVGTQFSYTITATGTPTPTLSYTNVPNGFNVNGATITGTFSAPGQVSIGIHATNTNGTSDKTLVVTVNQTPSITSALAATAFVGEVFNYTLTATGTPTPALSFPSVPPPLQATANTLSGTFTQTGQATATLRADNSAGFDQKTLTITIQQKPKITSPLTANATLGVPFSYQLTAIGTPTPTVSFGTLPNGFQTNPAGDTISGTFTQTGQVQIALHATSAIGNDDQTLTINVGGAASAITSPLTANALTGVQFSYQLTATGNPAPTLFFTNVPAGLTANGDTISGTFATAGQFMIGLHASNPGGNDDKTLVVTVDPSVAPAITSSLTATATVGVPFNYMLTATGNPAPVLSFTNLPNGFTALGSAFGGTFVTHGQYLVDLHATNVAGADDKTLVITVNPAPVTPVITSSLQVNGKVGVDFNYALTATGQPAPTLTFDNLPAGITVNGATISGKFTTSGQFSIGLQATNSQGSDDKTLIVNVAPADVAPNITSSLSVQIFTFTPFVYNLVANGTPPITYSFDNLPAGITANGSMLTGIFTVPGTYNIGLHATSSIGADDKTLVVTVINAPVGPHITSPLTATAIVGLDFFYTVTATGDPLITYGATLPSGFTLSGATISGIFTAPGTVMIPLTATNGTGSDQQTLVVTVAANTEGVSGTWAGKFKGKFFDETGSGKTSATDGGTIEVSFFQQGRELTAKITITRATGAKTYLANGRVGLNNLWSIGVDSGISDTLTLSAQANKNGKSIKGIGIVVNKSGATEFSYTLAKK